MAAIKQILEQYNDEIKGTFTYKEFLLLTKAKGYEIKGESFDEGAAKYITFRLLGKDRLVQISW